MSQINAAPPARQSLRAFLEQLEVQRQLHHVSDAVATDYEMSAWLAQLSAGKAVQFDTIKGHAVRAVGNILNSRERIAAGMNMTPDAMQAQIMA